MESTIAALTPETIRHALEQSRVLTLITSAYLPDERERINTVIDRYLHEAGKEQLKTRLRYCIQELASNAKKANTKRVYFREQGLDIRDPEAYLLGMKTFKQDTLGNIDHYLRLQQEEGLSITFQFLMKDDRMHFVIRNSTELLPVEEERIMEKLLKAKRFRTLADAYLSVEDSSEGAGLGIVMMILMLRELGPEEDILGISSRPGETTAVLTLRR